MNNKIGIGAITYNRLEFFQKCINSIPNVDELVIVNDGNPYPVDVYPINSHLIQHSHNEGIAKSKNDALKYLYDKGCEHIFICEDDIIIKNKNVLKYYVNASIESGIKHFNFAYAGRENYDAKGNLLIKKSIKINDTTIGFFKNLAGAFSYYHKDVFQSVGFMDTRYLNSLEHVDHTYSIIKQGLHPPFSWFADIFNSNELLDYQDFDQSRSTIRKSYLWKIKLGYNKIVFFLKHRDLPWRINMENEKIILDYLKKLNLD